MGVYLCRSATQNKPNEDKLDQIRWSRSLRMRGGDWGLGLAEQSSQPALVAGGPVGGGGGGGASFAVLQVVVPASPGVGATAYQCGRVPEGSKSHSRTQQHEDTDGKARIANI